MWSNPLRYDSRGGVQYVAADNVYWMSVRAYDPTQGRFISRDPLGRAALFSANQPYAYAGIAGL
jgi:RHS repeat-associated protein